MVSQLFSARENTFGSGALQVIMKPAPIETTTSQQTHKLLHESNRIASDRISSGGGKRESYLLLGLLFPQTSRDQQFAFLLLLLLLFPAQQRDSQFVVPSAGWLDSSRLTT